MASHAAIAAVSRTLRTLLLDRMVTGALITFAPPDIDVAGATGARINLYLMQLIENASLKNQAIPGREHPAAYGHPPLSLNLRYLVTSHSETENQPDSDINAQRLLGDAMRVFNDFGNALDQLTIINPVAGTPGDPILDPELANEFERLKIVLHPASLDDITKLWSAVSGANFRRSVIYEVTVIQIETALPRVQRRPVARRRIVATVRRRPEIIDAYVTPALPTDPVGERRARVGDDLSIVGEGLLADRLYVKLGALDPIRVAVRPDGIVRLAVPDAHYPPDLDHPLSRPIPPAQQLQPGPLDVRLISSHPVDGVEGGLDRGGPPSLAARDYASNSFLLQLAPTVTGVTPASGSAAAILKVDGKRLWHANAAAAQVLVGDAAIAVRHQPGDPWAAPSPTHVEVPLADAAALLPASATPYAVAAQVDGAMSRDPGFTFTRV